MKKNVLTLLLLLVAMLAQAADYPYLTFEMTDGQKTSVSVTSLSISIADGKLTVGGQTFDLSSLSKMYFSTASETTDISVVKNSQLVIDDDAEIYDLQGRKVSKDQMRHGIYVVKTKNGTFKVNMK
jgi:hypothetical protein